MRKTKKKTNRYFNQAIGLEPTTKYDKEDSSFYNRDCCLFLYPNFNWKEKRRMDSKLL